MTSIDSYEGVSASGKPYGVGLARIDEMDPTENDNKIRRWGDFCFMYGEVYRRRSILDDIAVRNKQEEEDDLSDNELFVHEIAKHDGTLTPDMIERIMLSGVEIALLQSQIRRVIAHCQSGGDTLPADPIVPGIDMGSIPLTKGYGQTATWHHPDHETTMELREHGLIGYRQDLFKE